MDLRNKKLGARYKVGSPEQHFRGTTKRSAEINLRGQREEIKWWAYIRPETDTWSGITGMSLCQKNTRNRRFYRSDKSRGQYVAGFLCWVIGIGNRSKELRGETLRRLALALYLRVAVGSMSF